MGGIKKKQHTHVPCATLELPENRACASVPFAPFFLRIHSSARLSLSHIHSLSLLTILFRVSALAARVHFWGDARGHARRSSAAAAATG